MHDGRPRTPIADRDRCVRGDSQLLEEALSLKLAGVVRQTHVLWTRLTRSGYWA